MELALQKSAVQSSSYFDIWLPEERTSGEGETGGVFESSSAVIPVSHAAFTRAELPAVSGPPDLVAEQPLSSGLRFPITLHIPPTQHQIIVDPSCQFMLTNRVKAVLEPLYELLEREARRNFIPFTKIEVRGFVDPEEDTQQIVVRQWVLVPAQAALEYWDRLGPRFEAWVKLLPEALTRTAEEQIALEVMWQDDDTSI